jgi:hypothetical protein
MSRSLQAGFAIALVLGIMAWGTGCRRHVGSLALASTETPQYERLASAPMTQNVQGKDGRVWFLVLPLKGEPKFEEAINRAIGSVQGDFMVNVRFYRTLWTCILLTYESREVIGDVGNSKGTQSLLVPAGTTRGQ